ncbi:peptide-methionine (S)-S-oxide reductase [Echinicola shivajiensis]|uniref:peptide-methionine (S)-S-oxide reductase n=1 Tax=Echinicola shivajiensis TaxID=1035916 RepID=UPI001BFC03E7|nr:peptide-methionine (S)-S-oxide reductase [Echinicola shivajiensis]
MVLKIGFGGGCHWCTEAVFQSLKGVQQVRQGWISSKAPFDEFSEAVLISFDPNEISLHDLIEIHLATHASTSNHSKRNKYRSAIYYISYEQKAQATECVDQLQKKFDSTIITQILEFDNFRENSTEFSNYYLNKRDAPFCKQYISPKLKLMREKYGSLYRRDFL